MKLVHTDRVLSRLTQLAQEVKNSTYWDCADRLQAFRVYCESTPTISYSLSSLPSVALDLQAAYWFRAERGSLWAAGDSGYAQRWSAIQEMASDPGRVDKVLSQIARAKGMTKYLDLTPYIGRLFVIPLYNYLAHKLQGTSSIIYTLLRYKRWAEWFEGERLRMTYAQGGETSLDRDLRRFLFESGIDYPFSQPDSPGGRADIVAQLDTGDPLVLEVKIWDSNRSYKENRVRDGLRQVMDYADKYGKDRGYVVVFNLDQHPLAFVSPVDTDEWPPRREEGGKTYYFIDVNIGEQLQSASKRDKGKSVDIQRIVLADLFRQSSDD